MSRRLTLIILFATVVLCVRCSDAGEPRISFTGDIIMHIPVKTSALSHNVLDADKKTSLNNNGYNFIFDQVRILFKDSDIVMGNMEFPVSPPFESKPRIFNAAPEVLAAMKWARFTMVTAANNHILDQGDQGVVNTLQYLRKYNFDIIGVGADEAMARAGVVKEVNGIRIGFISYTGYLNFPVPKKMPGYHLNWFYDKDNLKKDIEALRKRCDYLIMVLHTGVEYVTIPRTSDVELLKKCLNNGVDLVIGHHPHLLQPAEKVIADDGRECYIFYSLGNFISNQSTRAVAYFDGAPITTRDSAIVSCLLKRTGKGKRPEARFEIEPVYTKNIIDESSKRRVIQTVSINREIAGLKKSLTAAGAKEKVDIEGQLQNLYQKTKAIRIALFRNSVINEIKYNEDSGGYGR